MHVVHLIASAIPKDAHRRGLFSTVERGVLVVVVVVPIIKPHLDVYLGLVRFSAVVVCAVE